MGYSRVAPGSHKEDGCLPALHVEGLQMRKISIRLTDQHYEMLEALVTVGEYASVSEAIRDAIRKLLAEKVEVIERSQRMNSFV